MKRGTDADKPRCERCGESLDESKVALLELNNHTSEYVEPGTVPAGESQGCFTFGAACARKVRANGGVLVRIGRAAR